MSDIVVRHRQDGNLGDGAVAARHTTSSLVNGRQIRVHVTGETTTSRHFLAGGRHLTQGVAVRRKISKDNEDVLLELISIVFGGGKGETGSDDTLDAARC